MNVAFCGYGGSGKDEAAAHLIAAGYTRHNFGDHIKGLYDGVTSRSCEDLGRFTEILWDNLNPEFAPQDLNVFINDTLTPYWNSGRIISAFTEDRSLKEVIRPMLEHGGDLVYPMIESAYFTRNARITGPIVNTRACRVSEARRWREQGGVIIEVVRENWAPSTQWDADVIEALTAEKLIDYTIFNNSPSGEHWNSTGAPRALRAALATLSA